MKGLTTVARLPGSGNGRHMALEAQDFGKARPTPAGACSDERPCTNCFSNNGPCAGTSVLQTSMAEVDRILTQAVTDLLKQHAVKYDDEGIGKVADACIAAVSKATGLTIEELTNPRTPLMPGALSASPGEMGGMVWDEAAPISPLRWASLDPKATSLKIDMSPADLARFEEELRRTPASISAGYEAGEFEHQYMQRPIRPMTECALARFRPEDIAFLEANGVDPKHVTEMYRHESLGTTGYSVGGDTSVSMLVRNDKYPMQSYVQDHAGVMRVAHDPRSERKPRAKGCFTFANVKTRLSTPGGDVELSGIEEDASKGSLTGLSDSFGRLTARVSVSPQMTGQETLAAIASTVGLDVKDLQHCGIDYDSMKGTAEVTIPGPMSHLVRQRWQHQFMNQFDTAQKPMRGHASVDDKGNASVVRMTPSKVDRHLAKGKELDDLASKMLGLVRQRNWTGDRYVLEADDAFRRRLNEALGF